ncbi:MAG: DUF2892 domain-containing protein [Calditrichaceae bacterium]
MGNTERIIRIIAGLILISLAFIGPKTQLGWIGLLPLLTGLSSFCPGKLAVTRVFRKKQ